MSKDEPKISKNTDKIQGLGICMAELKTRMTNIENNQKMAKQENKENQNKLLNGQIKTQDRLEEFINGIHTQRLQDLKDNETKFASKEFEQAIKSGCKWVAITIGAIIIGAIMSLILIK